METFVRQERADRKERLHALTPFSASTVESGALNLHVQYMGQPVYDIPLVRRCAASPSNRRRLTLLRPAPCSPSSKLTSRSLSLAGFLSHDQVPR